MFSIRIGLYPEVRTLNSNKSLLKSPHHHSLRSRWPALARYQLSQLFCCPLHAEGGRAGQLSWPGQAGSRRGRLQSGNCSLSFPLHLSAPTPSIHTLLCLCQWTDTGAGPRLHLTASFSQTHRLSVHLFSYMVSLYNTYLVKVFHGDV